MVIEHLSEAYLVDVVEKTGKFCKQKDLFGLFDIIAIGNGFVFFIQITCGRPHTHKGYKKFAEEFGESNICTEQWVYKGNKKFDLYLYQSNGDIRKEGVVV